MKLNRVERLLMNNPARAWLQRHYEAKQLLRMGGRLDGKRVLEVGCGRGVGVEVLFESFGADHVTAFDVDPGMIELARRRLGAYSADQLQLGVGDAAAVDAPDGAFDAVFDFGIIHHVPRWRSAVREVARVLRPGGLFFFEEVTRQALDRWFYRTFLEHPTKDRFTASEFLAELDGHDIRPVTEPIRPMFGDFLIGVGRIGE